MRYYIFILVILSVFSFVSCKKKIANEKLVSINRITTNYDSLIYNVKVNGDTNAYDELFYGFIDSNEEERTDSVLLYSKIMALNFDYERAYFDYLKALCQKNGVKARFDNVSELDLKELDRFSKEMIVNWLNQMLQNRIITQEEFNSVRK